MNQTGSEVHGEPIHWSAGKEDLIWSPFSKVGFYEKFGSTVYQKTLETLSAKLSWTFSWHFDEQYFIDYLDNKICGSNLRTTQS